MCPGLVGQTPETEAKRFLIEHANELLGSNIDVVLDEIALHVPEPAAVEPYRELLNSARDIGIDTAYRPLLAAELLRAFLDADITEKQKLLSERADELLGDDVAATLSALREQEPESHTLLMHDALLDLSRSGRQDVAFEALTDPRRLPDLLAGLARDDDIAALGSLATLAVATAETPELRATAYFYKSIASTIAGAPEDGLELARHAQSLDGSQVPAWLAALVHLASRHPEVSALTTALTGSMPPT